MTPEEKVTTVRDPKVFADSLRKNLLELEEQTRQWIKQLKSIPFVDWEVIAQMTLALRHIEDARMRYGKVIQYLNTMPWCNAQSLHSMIQ